MNNPHSTDPGQALLPEPSGSAGYRLWRMSGMEPEKYLLAFERRNLLDLLVWSPSQAHEAAEKFRAEYRGRTVIALGGDVWLAFRIPQALPCACVALEAGPTIYFLPHPSGRNLHYNDKLNRRAVGKLLRKLSSAAQKKERTT